ncbi:uncharacterized protein ACJ7VT_000554 isoform 2-T2 [Polymixia lowei]
MQYLQYVDLDEPIIGLNHLEEVPRSDASDPQPGPRYLCRLCDLDANLPNMVNHIIGRKHRQKYLQTQRQDLVTWNKTNISNQSSKVIRAKAEVVERQDGQGTPKPMRKRGTVGKSNISRVLPKHKQKKDLNVPQDAAQRGMPPYHPQLTDYQADYSRQGEYPPYEPTAPPFHPNDPYMMAEEERGAYLREDPLQRDHMKEEDLYRQKFMESDYHRDYQQDYVEDKYRRDILEAGGISGHGSWEKMPPRETAHEDAYPEEAPQYRRPYPESDPLKQFYSEEVKRGRVRTAEAAEPSRRAYPSDEPRGQAYPERDPYRYSYPPEDAESQYSGEGPRGRAYPSDEPGRGSIDYSQVNDLRDEGSRQKAAHEDPYSADAHRGGFPEEEARRRAYPEHNPLQPVYPADQQHRWSHDREPSRHGNIHGPGRQGRGDPVTKRRFAEPMERDQQYDEDDLFEMVRAFREKRGPYQEEAVGSAGSSRTGPPTSQRPPEGTRMISEIPEPFRRFLEGATGSQDNRKRKRSRFSDATKEEMERAKGMLIDAYRPPNLEDHMPPRAVHGPTRPEVHEPQRPDPYIKSESPYHTEGYQRGGFESFSENSTSTGAVFDLLKNIEIENGEEADFLKNKLCNLLKEFQAKKSEKTVHKSQGPTVRNYNHMSQNQEVSPQGQYERTFREGPEERPFENQLRPPQELYSQEAQRGRGWEEREGLLEEKFQEYRHPGHPDSQSSSRSRYEEVFGPAKMYKPPHSPHREEAALYPERFQESINPHKYPPATHSPAPPLHREHGYRMHRGPQQSSSLDKITSTLLELVARK